jgi:hypothetical protein
MEGAQWFTLQIRKAAVKTISLIFIGEDQEEDHPCAAGSRTWTIPRGEGHSDLPGCRN